MASNLTAAVECQVLPGWAIPVGIVMGVFGSIGINIGQNLQADGIAALPEEKRGSPAGSPKWRMGMAVFIAFSLVNFAASALAPLSVLMPIESVQFPTNVAYNKFVNKAPVSSRMLVGVALSLVGTVLSVVFGAQGDDCMSVQQLEALWLGVPWLIYFTLSLAIAAVAFVWHFQLVKRSSKRGDSSTGVLRPVLFTLSSALAGGAQMIVHSKAFSTLLSLLFQGDTTVFTASYILYLELALVVLCGIIWVFRQTQGLSLYNPLVILPLLVGVYILFGGIAGGIFYNEFQNLHKGPGGWARWPIYLTGLSCVLIGLYLIASAGQSMDLDHGAVELAAVDGDEEEATTAASAEMEGANALPRKPALSRIVSLPEISTTAPVSTSTVRPATSPGGIVRFDDSPGVRKFEKISREQVLLHRSIKSLLAPHEALPGGYHATSAPASILPAPLKVVLSYRRLDSIHKQVQKLILDGASGLVDVLQDGAEATAKVAGAGIGVAVDTAKGAVEVAEKAANFAANGAADTAKAGVKAANGAVGAVEKAANGAVGVVEKAATTVQAAARGNLARAESKKKAKAKAEKAAAPWGGSLFAA